MTVDRNLTQITSSIVMAYVLNNSIPSEDVGGLVIRVHGALARLGEGPQEAATEKATPAVNPKKSVFPEYIVCLEDGKRFKSMKRHLSASHGLTPAEYRQKWGLPADYPVVAPDYAAVRSGLALGLGLGRQKKAEPPSAPAKRKGDRKTGAV